MTTKFRIKSINNSFNCLTCSLHINMNHKMTFSEFLKKIKETRNAGTTKDLYEKLGGNKSLGISLPYFQQIESGMRPPSSVLFENLFNIIPNSEKRDLVLSYLKSTLSDGSSVIPYVEKSMLFPNNDLPSKWDQETTEYYSDEQLKTLLYDSEILSTYLKILLLENCDFESLKGKERSIKKLKDMNLIIIKKGKVTPHGTAYLLPSLSGSSKSRSKRLCTEYILKIFNLFLDHEGSEYQELRYGVQFVNKDTADQILNEVKALRDRFFSQATTEPDLEKKIPAVFIGFAKLFNIEELD